MKKLVLIPVLLFGLQSISGQSLNPNDWLVSTSVGLEAHDRRGYRLDRELTTGVEARGTHHAGIQMHRKVMEAGRLSLFGGLGMSYENASFLRSFDHCHFYEGLCNSILLKQDDYTKLSAPTSAMLWFRVIKNLYLSADIEANWLVYRRITNSRVEEGGYGFPFSETTFELDDVQLMLGANYQLNRWILGVKARAANYQRIDNILFSRHIEQDWEWYNPLRVDLTLGYTW